MNKQLIIASFAMSVFSGYSQHTYPVTKKVQQVDDYFGTKVEDPYRWLEDDRSEATKAWVIEENTFTANYLATIPFRATIKNQIKEKWNY